MRLIVGLGNPGKNYESTRHNVGFMVIDELAKSHDVALRLEKKFNSEIGEIQEKGEKIILAKPQTFVNQSGDAISKISSFYKIKEKDIWIIIDDVEMPLGSIRVRLEGSSGGHRGLESIINGLSTENFPRIKIGTGPTTNPEGMKEFDHLSHQPILDLKEFVLEPFTKRELPVIKKVINSASETITEAFDRQEGLSSHTIEIS